MNKVILMGNLTRDPEIRYTQGNNMAIARFSLAVNRKYAKEGEAETDFFNLTAFGKQAEFVEKYFKKGSRMLVSGRIQNDNYINKNGEKVYSVQIITDDIEFCERKGAKNDDTPGPPPASSNDDDFVDIDTSEQSEIPFFG